MEYSPEWTTTTCCNKPYLHSRYWTGTGKLMQNNLFTCKYHCKPVQFNWSKCGKITWRKWYLYSSQWTCAYNQLILFQDFPERGLLAGFKCSFYWYRGLFTEPLWKKTYVLWEAVKAIQMLKVNTSLEKNYKLCTLKEQHHTPSGKTGLWDL